MPAYLTKSRGRFLFTMGVPEKHREIVRARWPNNFTGATTIKKSLGTSDPREPAKRAAPLIALWTERLAEIESACTSWGRARAELAGLGVTFSAAPPLPNPDFNLAALTLTTEAQQQRRRFAAAKDRLLASVPAGIPIDADAALAPVRSEIEGRLARMADLLEPYGADPAKIEVERRGLSFADAVDRWKSDRSPAAGTMAQVAGVAKRWTAQFGGRPIGTITKRDILAWRTAMQVAGDVTPQRVNTIIAYAGGVLAAAEAAGLIEANPIVRVRSLTAAGTGRDAFTATELGKLLRHADTMSDEGAGWLLRLGAYTGARLHELAQLTDADVINSGGILALDINGRGGKTIKNRASWRVVPVHPDIAGELREFIKGRTGRLFWPGGEASHAVGMEITAAGVRRDGVCFHSLRHTFKNLCREAGLLEEVHDALTGHSGGGVGRKYGARPPLPVLAEAMARLIFVRHEMTGA